MKKTKLSRIDGVIFRKAEIAKDAVINEEERTVRVSFSSEIEVLRSSWFEDPWLEVLGHKSSEVNLERFENGASVHYNHSRSRADRVGVVESVKIRKGRGEAVVRFSQNERVNDIWDDVKDGILRNISVGYSIDERTLVKSHTDGPDEFRITRWTPMELSFVDIPADPTVGVGREGLVDSSRAANYSITQIVENDPMKLKRVDGETDAEYEERQRVEDVRVAVEEQTRQQQQTPAPIPVVTTASEDALALARSEGVEAGAVQANERRTEINTLLAPFESRLGDGFIEFRDAQVDGNTPVEDVRTALLDKLGKDSVSSGGDVRVIETSGEKFRSASAVAIQLRAGLIDPKEREAQVVIAQEVRSYTLFEMARRSLELDGVATGRLAKMELVGRAFTTSDFPLILADAANKAMLKGFEEAAETWMVWAQKGNLSDFKIGNRVGLSSFDDLVLVNENGEYKYGTFTEQGETIQLATYGKLFSISRQAIINDDLNAFTVIPSRMGRASSRVVGDLAYGALTSNPVMGDGIALFDAAHNNLNESGGGGTPLTADAAGTAAFAAMRNAMALQTDANNAATGLNIRPAHFLVPVVLEDTANTLMKDTTKPGQANPGTKNQIQGQAEVVSDPRLDSDSVTRYYLAASKEFDTIEVAFLDGIEAPTLEQQAGWSIDGTEFKVRIDVGTAPMEFRTWQRDDGT